jgi:bifunctional ADP-heptose synthase (sugar kinase/adenylyltransferase)
MLNKIYLVQHDQLPDIQVTLTDLNNNGAPVDLSGTGTTVSVPFRLVGATSLTDTLACTIVNAAGGVLAVHFGASSLTAPGEYEGEIKVTYPDGRVRTVYDRLRFSVRASFA